MEIIIEPRNKTVRPSGEQIIQTFEDAETLQVFEVTTIDNFGVFMKYGKELISLTTSTRFKFQKKHAKHHLPKPKLVGMQGAEEIIVNLVAVNSTLTVGG